MTFAIFQKGISQETIPNSIKKYYEHSQSHNLILKQGRQRETKH